MYIYCYLSLLDKVKRMTSNNEEAFVSKRRQMWYIVVVVSREKPRQKGCLKLKITQRNTVGVGVGGDELN